MKVGVVRRLVLRKLITWRGRNMPVVLAYRNGITHSPVLVKAPARYAGNQYAALPLAAKLRFIYSYGTVCAFSRRAEYCSYA